MGDVMGCDVMRDAMPCDADPGGKEGREGSKGMIDHRLFLACHFVLALITNETSGRTQRKKERTKEQFPFSFLFFLFSFPSLLIRGCR